METFHNSGVVLPDKLPGAQKNVNGANMVPSVGVQCSIVQGEKGIGLVLDVPKALWASVSSHEHVTAELVNSFVHSNARIMINFGSNSVDMSCIDSGRRGEQHCLTYGSTTFGVKRKRANDGTSVMTHIGDRYNYDDDLQAKLDAMVARNAHLENLLNDHKRSVQPNQSKDEDVKPNKKVKKRSDKPKQSRYWTKDEHNKFLEALSVYGRKNVKEISNFVGTRTATQVRTHAQKWFLKLKREEERKNEARERERLEREEQLKRDWDKMQMLEAEKKKRESLHVHTSPTFGTSLSPAFSMSMGLEQNSYAPNPVYATNTNPTETTTHQLAGTRNRGTQPPAFSIQSTPVEQPFFYTPEPVYQNFDAQYAHQMLPTMNWPKHVPVPQINAEQNPKKRKSHVLKDVIGGPVSLAPSFSGHL